jgi:hypothetical protein
MVGDTAVDQNLTISTRNSKEIHFAEQAASQAAQQAAQIDILNWIQAQYRLPQNWRIHCAAPIPPAGLPALPAKRNYQVTHCTSPLLLILIT